jgi:Undecaprenyl-phosphate glucose phosphotransferase
MSDVIHGEQPRGEAVLGGLAASVPVLSHTIYGGLVRVAETAMLSAVGYLAALAYVAEQDVAGSVTYAVIPLTTAVLTTIIYQSAGLYRVAALSSVFTNTMKLVAGWVASLGLLVTAFFFMKSGSDFSRGWVAIWFVSGLVTIFVLRAIVQARTLVALSQGRFARRAVVYGSGPRAEQVIRDLTTDASADVRICGVFDDRDVGPTETPGEASALVAFCRRNAVDMVIVALPLAAEERVDRLMRYIHVLPADIRMAATASALKFSPHAYSYVGSVPMLDLSERPISDWGLVAKGVFDKIVAGLALMVLAPVMVLIAFAIRLESRGPVFFRQKRFGFNNEMIEVLKFRSMYQDHTDAQASRLVTRDDPRVTRVGRILRKTSLDELPQLINVLRGDLSLVGPRPHAAQAKAAGHLYPDVVGDYFARHKVKPGITGWAQINGWRGETDTPEKIQKRVEHDLFYINHWSLLLDVVILLRTPWSLISQRDNAF